MNWKYFFAISILFPLLQATESFKLIIVLYNEKNSDRLSEYLTCLDHNLNHKLIDTIHIIYDTSKDDQENKLFNLLQTKKVKITFINDRPSYGYCFNLAN